MFNFLFGVVFVLINFMFFLLCYRIFGRTGLYVWIGVATIIANIQVTKSISLLGVIITLGNTTYGTLYMATDLLNEKYGEKEARKAVWVGFFVLVMTTILMQMALAFHPQPGDFAQKSLEKIFGLMPRLAAGSLLAYLTSQFIDVKIFSFIKKYFPKPNQLWIRNNGSTLISQLIDTCIFCTVAFYGEYPLETWLQILISTYVIKFVISIISTPFLYIARGFRVDDEEEMRV